MLKRVGNRIINAKYVQNYSAQDRCWSSTCACTQVFGHTLAKHALRVFHRRDITTNICWLTLVKRHTTARYVTRSIQRNETWVDNVRHVSTVHDKEQLMMNNLELTRQNVNKEPECSIGEVRDDTHCSTIDLSEVSPVDKRPFACSECGKILKTRSHFYTHKLIHQLNQTGERPHPCIVCGKRFLTYSHMKRHSRVHDDLRPYRCPECSKSFKTAFLLKVHLRTHSTEKNFQCNECGKSFKTSSHFYTHKLIHKLQETGERPHLCMVCGKSFYTSSHLKHHMKVHVDDRPFRCVECGKDFKWAIALKTHARTLTGERPYKCPSCQKCFTQPGHLKSHTSLHVGEKPCVCHVCCKTFANGGSLKTHMRKQHKSKNVASPANIDLSNDIVDAGACSSSRNSFTCSVCCKQFSCASSLRHHLIVHTGEKQFYLWPVWKDFLGKTVDDSTFENAWTWCFLIFRHCHSATP